MLNDSSINEDTEISPRVSKQSGAASTGTDNKQKGEHLFVHI